jgi:pseudaminic acid synthase
MKLKKNFLKNLDNPIIIGEVSANHGGSINKAKELIKCAKINNLDFVKLQTYEEHTMTIPSKNKEFLIKKGIWKNYSLWDLYKKAKTPFSWHNELFSYAKKIGIKCISTPFDEYAVDLLEDLGCPMYKISSFELTHLPLIKKVAKTKKPVIISTGMGTLNEIAEAVNEVKKYGVGDYALLYCVSNYPAKIDEFNLKNIELLRKKFNCTVGLSDHSINSDIAKLSLAYGARIIEKHIALDNQKKGLDVKFSIK